MTGMMVMSLPETEKMHNDVVDFLIEASKTKQTVEKDGKQVEEYLVNPKTIWYKTQNIHSNLFGAFVKALEDYANMSIDAFNHMGKEQANVLGNQIMRRIESYNFSIDAKSSETVRDKNNNSSNVLHILTHKTIEKKYNVKGEGKKTLLDGMLGRQGANETAE